ncbi:hypothetical protein EV356DRAFT_499446 [Viridothelium virens]|uniref:Uncharacterized protein n=1 Tax=Viridothelium virens TaxID=1048519 RepID=A0A6A6HD34_VIRVR|nr:hypothetical protein EV356DRAFT_499446 [Viridothelium virens]
MPPSSNSFRGPLPRPSGGPLGGIPGLLPPITPPALPVPLPRKSNSSSPAKSRPPYLIGNRGFSREGPIPASSRARR